VPSTTKHYTYNVGATSFSDVVACMKLTKKLSYTCYVHSACTDSAPAVIKLYINRDSMGFSDCEVSLLLTSSHAVVAETFCRTRSTNTFALVCTASICAMFVAASKHSVQCCSCKTAQPVAIVCSNFPSSLLPLLTLLLLLLLPHCTVRCTLQDIEATQVLELTAEDLQPDSVTLLKFVKFQRVSSLSIFVEENNGAETTALSSIKFFGAPVATTKMGDFKKQEHSH
jgi:PITH domain